MKEGGGGDHTINKSLNKFHNFMTLTLQV